MEVQTVPGWGKAESAVINSGSLYHKLTENDILKSFIIFATMFRINLADQDVDGKGLIQCPIPSQG